MTDTSTEARFLIRKGGAYYRPNARGYTTSVIQAGRYTEKEAYKHSHPNGPDGPRDNMSFIHEDDITNDEDWNAYRALAAERDALRAAILKHVEDFRPIDTAPKNGEWFIGMNEFYPQFLQPMSYHAETGRYAVISPDAPDGMVKTIRPDYPTHWWPPAIKGKDDA